MRDLKANRPDTKWQVGLAENTEAQERETN